MARRLGFIFLLFLFSSLSNASPPAKLLAPMPKDESQLNALLYSLKPQSVSELLAFYKLYPSTDQGKLAQLKAWQLLTKHHPTPPSSPYELAIPDLDLDSLITLINKRSDTPPIELDERALKLIDSLCSFLPNRTLKGYKCCDQETILSLPSEEIDLARALLLFEELPLSKIVHYEAAIDLMALQILATLPPNASSREKVKAISQFIFYEEGFRFPPHSLYAEDIDLYTFLPTVLDSRQGVCLGVSILYLCLAQRLALNLEIVTPPGHIFVRLPEEGLNIETTARGIHLEDEVYLGINTRKLKFRTLKEVVGLAFINQASVFWHKKEHTKVVDLYRKAQLFLNDDPLLKTLLAYNLLILDKAEEATPLLQQVKNIAYDDAVAAERLPIDLLEGRIDKEGVQAVFESVDETRTSIEKKQCDLRAILKKWPRFRDGWLHLAVTYLQLGRSQEAYESLLAYHNLDPHNPTVEYYLALLSLKRVDYPSAAKYLVSCLSITKSREHDPKALKQLKQEIHNAYPE